MLFYSFEEARWYRWNGQKWAPAQWRQPTEPLVTADEAAALVAWYAL